MDNLNKQTGLHFPFLLVINGQAYIYFKFTTGPRYGYEINLDTFVSVFRSGQSSRSKEASVAQ